MMSTFFCGILYIGGNNMSNMRTIKEKEVIIKDYLSGTGIAEIERKYLVRNAQVYRWLERYKRYGIEGLKSNTGKSKGGNKGIGARKPKNKIEELELEIMKKDIEIARLKKGYFVKGVRAKKEYVTSSNKN